MKATQDLDPIIPRGAAREMLGGINRETMRDWEKSGRLPPPIYLSSRVVGWRRSTLEAFIAECSAESAGGR